MTKNRRRRRSLRRQQQINFRRLDDNFRYRDSDATVIYRRRGNDYRPTRRRDARRHYSDDDTTDFAPGAACSSCVVADIKMRGKTETDKTNDKTETVKRLSRDCLETRQHRRTFRDYVVMATMTSDFAPGAAL